ARGGGDGAPDPKLPEPVGERLRLAAARLGEVHMGVADEPMGAVPRRLAMADDEQRGHQPTAADAVSTRGSAAALRRPSAPIRMTDIGPHPAWGPTWRSTACPRRSRPATISSVTPGSRST